MCELVATSSMTINLFGLAIGWVGYVCVFAIQQLTKTMFISTRPIQADRVHNSYCCPCNICSTFNEQLYYILIGKHAKLNFHLN